MRFSMCFNFYNFAFKYISDKFYNFLLNLLKSILFIKIYIYKFRMLSSTMSSKFYDNDLLNLFCDSSS